MSLPTTVGHAFLLQAVHSLDAGLDRIRHCVGQLDDAQLWWRPHAAMNSIANLLLHLCGNLTQWIVAGVTEASDRRDRPQEFAERGPIPKAELLARLEAVAGAAREVLRRTSDTQLLELRR